MSDRSRRRRRVRQVGAAAVDWFEQRGLRVHHTSGTLDDVAVVVDELSARAFDMQRIWHTPLAISPDVTASGTAAADTLTVILQVSGEAQLGIDDDRSLLSPNDLAAFPASRRWSIATSIPTARMELRSSGPLLRALTTPRVLSSMTPHPGPGVLAALVNSAMNFDEDISPLFVERLHRAASSIIEGALADDRTPEKGARRSAVHLYDDAMQYIRLWAHNSNVSVESVAEAMNVSRQYLTRAFRAHGTTPSIEILRHRVALSSSLRDAGVHAPSERARLSGFGSVWALSRAERLLGPGTIDSCSATPPAPARGSRSSRR